MTRPSLPGYFILLLFLCLSFSPTAGHNVAIVGGGIGGAACAYFLHLFAPDVVVDVYEKESIVGGRLKHVTFGGEVCEVGGDAWSSVNTYLMQIMKILDVPMSNNSFDGNGKNGFYEGNQRWFTGKAGPLAEAKFYADIELFKYHLSKNYEERDKHDTPFSTIEEFVDAGGIDEYSSIQMGEFLENHKINSNLALGLILPAIRGIYDQNLSVSAFAGIVSVLPALTDAYTVMGGNSLLVEMLLNASTAKVHVSSPVSEISKTGNGYQITTNDGAVPITYDSVVIAHPFEFGNITFSNISLPTITPRHYQHWYVTLVSASGLQTSYFGDELNPVPDNVFTTGNSTAPFNVVYPIAQSPNGNPVYKIFSNDPMEAYLDDIFINMTDYFVQVWPYTFPDLSPQKSYQPIILAEGLYYANTMESVATAMECSTIAGRNIALLIAKNVTKM